MLGAEPPELASSDHVSCRDGVDKIIKRGRAYIFIIAKAR